MFRREVMDSLPFVGVILWFVIILVWLWIAEKRGLASLLRRFPQLTEQQAIHVYRHCTQIQIESISSSSEAERIATSIGRAVDLAIRLPRLSIDKARFLEERLRTTAFDKIQTQEDVEQAVDSIRQLDKQVQLDTFRKTCLKQ